MADKTTEKRQVIYELTYNDGTTRNLSFDTAKTSSNKVSFQAFADKLKTDYKYMIQRASWRDADDDEEVATIVDVKTSFKTTTTTEFDT